MPIKSCKTELSPFLHAERSEKSRWVLWHALLGLDYLWNFGTAERNVYISRLGQLYAILKFTQFQTYLTICFFDHEEVDVDPLMAFEETDYVHSMQDAIYQEVKNSVYKALGDKVL